MSSKYLLFIAIAAVALHAYPFEWEHLTPEDRIGGRMVSPGYLRGKIVLIDRRDYGELTKANINDIRKLQATWAAYKTKPFILLGSHKSSGGSRKRVEKVMQKIGVTYPVYEDAWISDPEASNDDAASLKREFESEKPVLSLIDSTGRRRLFHITGDIHKAIGGIPASLFRTSSPATAEQYKELLEWEVTYLPGQAYLRLKDFRSQFPAEASAFDEAYKKLAKSEEVKRLAKLVELARLVKDRDASTEQAKRITKSVLEKTIEKYDDLKQSDNEYIAQEAKNALAELKWAQAGVK